VSLIRADAPDRRIGSARACSQSFRRSETLSETFRLSPDASLKSSRPGTAAEVSGFTIPGLACLMSRTERFSIFSHNFLKRAHARSLLDSLLGALCHARIRMHPAYRPPFDHLHHRARTRVHFVCYNFCIGAPGVRAKVCASREHAVILVAAAECDATEPHSRINLARA